MLVHRDKDDQSGGSDPSEGRVAKPRLVSPSPDPQGNAQPHEGGSDDAAHDDGKSHLIGDALKSVYQRTLEEDIPDDFLDLLKQLK